ncbi:hypothetical protein CCMSSC00406_0007493 [Pleurotus cornucopiae]|uniref:Uncharacterized protein n=1 Tax=Pleurotus cornucopiae TaxID=5321 RepID=A0ACB7J8Q7_PLECO|nr:hypothetical protein CCMSSC00406_0007493 [Pleurotus cornucopiae]
MSMVFDVVSDDEIQYMGSRRNVLPSPTPFTHHQSPVAGIVLHVAPGHNEPESSLTFHKSVAVVHIGRRPGSDADANDRSHEKGRALFRCAVVSRKHAKISFSDNGTIQLCDIGSHHGTHLRHAGETDSRMLEAGQPTTILDGDVITFGKAVGRNNEIVRPVAVRVEIMTQRHGSGRYGLYAPSIAPTPTSADSTSSSSSSEDDSSHSNFDHSDHDSDIEEISCPTGSQGARSQSMTGSAIALRLFQRLLPPMRVLEKDEAAFCTLSPINYPPQGPQPETSAPIVDLRSRSHSPMMLESPSGTPLPTPSPPLPSAQPPSPPRTPEPAQRVTEDPKTNEELAPANCTPPAQPSFPTMSAPPAVQPSPSFRRLFPIAARPLPLSIPPHPLLATRSELKELKDAINNMKDKLADPEDALDSLREKVALLEKEQAALRVRGAEMSKDVDDCRRAVDDHQEQIVDLEDRVAELDSMRPDVKDMTDIDGDTPMSNSSLHASISEVREDIESLRRSFSERSASMDVDTSTSAQALETKMSSLCGELEARAADMLQNLRTEWEDQKAQYTLQLQRTQNDAMQDIVLTSQVCASPGLRTVCSLQPKREAAALVSLKRKRSLEEVDGAHERQCPSHSAEAATSDGVDVPSLKRKRVLAAVAHTATAMTLGAVTAWSVLAFT